MGLNTVILILNDRLDDIIERPEEFSENVIQAIRDSSKNQMCWAASIMAVAIIQLKIESDCLSKLPIKWGFDLFARTKRERNDD